MLYDEFFKDISLKNSVVIARTLSDLFSNADDYTRFITDINKYKGNHSMQKFVWNRELDRHLRNLTSKENVEEVLSGICTDSKSLQVVGTIKHSYKLITLQVHTDIPLEYEERTYIKISKHIYAESKQIVEVPADTTFEIHKFNLLKLLLEDRFLGIMSNAKIKVPNNSFSNGIETPFDIFNRCIIQLDKQE